MNHVTPIAPYIDDFEDIEGSLPGASNAKISELRRQAARSYRAQGFPTRKIESWHYTRLNALESGDFTPLVLHGVSPTPSFQDAGIAGEKIQIVLVDGHLAKDPASDVDVPGLTIRSLATCLQDEDPAVISALDRYAPEEGQPLASLATAYLNGGVVVQVAQDAKIDPIIELVSVTTGDEVPKISFPRVLIQVGDNADVTIVGSFSGEGHYAVNAVTDIDLGEGANLKHYILQEQSSESTHVYLGRCDVPASAKYEGYILQLGAKVARHEMHLRMVGENAQAVLNGVYGVRGRGHCDTTTVVEHISPETFTDQVFKGILDDSARGVYQGQVLVHRDAQRINGNQLHNAMLLSPKAQANCKPELEIYADDVKCSHGATVGELDLGQLFYLRSRGIDDATARSLLIQAFLQESLDLISDGAVRDAFAQKALSWFQAKKEANL